MRYTDIKLPAKDPGSYRTLRRLADAFDMLTFDGLEEEKPMGVIAGSFPSYIGNLHNIFFFLSHKRKFKIQRSDIFLLEVKNDFIAVRV